MQNTRASVRYAKSLLTLSIEKKVLDVVKAEIDMVCKSFDESREISNLYLSPIIPINHKLDFPSVGVTHFFLMISSLIEGESIIRNAAMEPEIISLANMLNKMGCLLYTSPSPRDS